MTLRPRDPLLLAARVVTLIGMSLAALVVSVTFIATPAVVVMRDTELAIFTERAKQTRHCHKIGTEIYTLLEGEMTMEVAGKLYTLCPGDTLVVKPGVWHEVKRDSRFLCQVVTVNCAGAKDRHES